MSRKTSNGVINSMAIITESFHKLDLDDEGVLRILDNQMFLHLFENVPDPRQQTKIKYKLSNLLLMIFLSIMERGKISFVVIADIIWAKQKVYGKYGIIEEGQCPSHDTIRRILTIIDGNALYENTLNGFYQFLQCLRNNCRKEGDYKHLAFDGKEFRGSGRSKDTRNPKGNIAMLNVYDTDTGTVIECIPIDEKESEIPAAQAVFETMDLSNTVLTADALHCQKVTAGIITNQKGVYILTVKDNQPLLLQEIKARFENPKSKIAKYELDGRVIEILSLPKNYVLADDWSGLKSFARMYSSRGKNPCIRHFICNTSDHRLINDGITLRWSCEVMHKVKDCDLYEDAIRSTDKKALQKIAILNNLAVQLIKLYQALSTEEPHRAKIYFQVNTVECLNYMLGIMSSEEIIDSLVKNIKKQKRTRQ